MEKYYKTADFAAMAGVSVRTLQRWHQSGKLKASKTEGRALYYEVHQLRQAWELKPAPKVPAIEEVECSEELVPSLKKETMKLTLLAEEGAQLFLPYEDYFSFFKTVEICLDILDEKEKQLMQAFEEFKQIPETREVAYQLKRKAGAIRHGQKLLKQLKQLNEVRDDD